MPTMTGFSQSGYGTDPARSMGTRLKWVKRESEGEFLGWELGSDLGMGSVPLHTTDTRTRAHART